MSQYLIIRQAIAGQRDLKYIDAMQKAHSRALGFFPASVLLEKIDLGRVWIAAYGGNKAGYLIHGALTASDVRIFQVCVDSAFHRMGVARALVEHVYKLARNIRTCGGKPHRLSLRVRPDLCDSIAFWRAVGFEHTSDEDGLWVMTREIRVRESGVRGRKANAMEGR